MDLLVNLMQTVEEVEQKLRALGTDSRIIGACEQVGRGRVTAERIALYGPGGTER